MVKEKTERFRIRSVVKAVNILLLVAEAGEGRSAKEVSDALGLPIATAYHLLDTLAAEGMLAKDSRKRYHLGPRIGVLSEAFMRHPSAPEFLLTPLRRLAEETGETAYLSGWQHDEVVVLSNVEGSNAVRVRGLYIGFSGFAHARASGKLFLAYARPAVRERYLASHPLQARTPWTITDPDALAEELERVRDVGHAFDEQEFTIGVSGASAPVLSDGVVIATYTVSVPSDRFDAAREELLAAVQVAARTASDRSPVPTA